MDIQKLDYFLTAAKLENFTQAADRCGIAQTTMSKYIQQLEEEFDCSLFSRTNKGCELTSQGRIFYEKAIVLKKIYSDLCHALHQDSSQVLNLALDGAHFFMNNFKEFQKANPMIRLNVSFDTEQGLLDSLIHKRVHAIVLPNIISEKLRNFTDLKSYDFLRAQDYLAFPAGTTAKYGSVAEALKNLPFTTKSPDSEYYNYCREKLRERYGETFREVRYVQNQNDQNMMLELAQGFAILPMTELSGHLDLEHYRLGEDFLEMLQLFYNPKNMNEALRLLLRFLEERGVIEY